MNVEVGIVAEAEVEVVEYGPLRLAVAEWAGKDPSEVTGDDVDLYVVTEGKGQLP
ncbi:hypothetical protein KUG88_28385 [Rhodococcus rhodochrous]|uniref:hypothetical protein n=1 Tax=Rhodococcus rhodochrous TaxID=1829 RepID=UPI001E3ACB9F|nr:hypothetical protein [Rhodococcus rhodochrous]MCB8914022.1 hypothetical protein [Rhodococcus rhodochrous]